jgi:hypothetical protein
LKLDIRSVNPTGAINKTDGASTIVAALQSRLRHLTWRGLVATILNFRIRAVIVIRDHHGRVSGLCGTSRSI